MVCLPQPILFQNLTDSLEVDFGYILGRDPKPFPPPVKVCKEMVDAMGGAQSSHYAKFKNYCFTAFSILRKSANLILNLVALMVEANIPDIKHRDVHEQIQEKFRLDLTEEDAIKHFETLLNETSYFTVVFDRIHDLAQVCVVFWRDYKSFTNARSVLEVVEFDGGCSRIPGWHDACVFSYHLVSLAITLLCLVLTGANRFVRFVLLSNPIQYD